LTAALALDIAQALLCKRGGDGLALAPDGRIVSM
jgi:hypothetical protein